MWLLRTEKKRIFENIVELHKTSIYFSFSFLNVNNDLKNEMKIEIKIRFFYPKFLQVLWFYHIFLSYISVPDKQ